MAAKAREFEAAALVFGLPLGLDGNDSPRAQATRAFAREYQRLFPTPVAFWDERMSTAAVTRDLIANDVSRAKRADVIDKMAAAYILQGALDRLRVARRPDPARFRAPRLFFWLAEAPFGFISLGKFGCKARGASCLPPSRNRGIGVPLGWARGTLERR